VPISLDSTTASGDIDFQNQEAHIIGGVPGLPGVSGEIIIWQSYVYTRAYGATMYSMSGTSTLPMNPTSASAGPLFIVTQVLAVADDPGSNPQLVGIEQEPGGSCYHIRINQIDDKALNSSLSSLQTVQAMGGGKLDLWITQGSFELERLEFSTTDPSAGAAAVRLVLSNWNSISAIKPPDADQFNLPSY
jgi:hypothetical protein